MKPNSGPMHECGDAASDRVTFSLQTPSKQFGSRTIGGKKDSVVGNLIPEAEYLFTLIMFGLLGWRCWFWFDVCLLGMRMRVLKTVLLQRRGGAEMRRCRDLLISAPPHL